MVCEDTGKPMPYARLLIQSHTKSEQGYIAPAGIVDGKADGQGRFKISIIPGSSGFVNAVPPDGQPYLTGATEFDWPKGAVRQEVVVKVPRGLLLHGKVTEAGSGRPLANASVQYQNWNRRDAHRRRRELHARRAARPGPWPYPRHRPDAGLHRPADRQRPRESGQAWRRRRYYHAAAALDLKR